jgi:hypothetical protein
MVKPRRHDETNARVKDQLIIAHQCFTGTLQDIKSLLVFMDTALPVRLLCIPEQARPAPSQTSVFRGQQLYKIVIFVLFGAYIGLININLNKVLL